MDNLDCNANGDLEIDTGERAWETALISKESSRGENCTICNCMIQWQSVIVLAGLNRLKIVNKISIQTHFGKKMAIALPAAAVIMHLWVWHPIIAIKTFVVGGFICCFCGLGFAQIYSCWDFFSVLDPKIF